MSEQKYSDDRYFVLGHNQGAKPTEDFVFPCFTQAAAEQLQRTVKFVLRYDNVFIYHSPGAMIPPKEKGGNYEEYRPRNSAQTTAAAAAEEEVEEDGWGV